MKRIARTGLVAITSLSLVACLAAFASGCDEDKKKEDLLAKAGASAKQVYDLLRGFGYSLRTLENTAEITDFETLPHDTNYWLMGSPSARAN